jgi:hypothetical protein
VGFEANLMVICNEEELETRVPEVLDEVRMESSFDFVLIADNGAIHKVTRLWSSRALP